MSRAKHQPTTESRAQVKAYAMVGVPHHQIGSLIGCSIKPLLRCYREELDQGKALAVAKIGKSLYEQAVSGNLGAICFYLKCQAGWRETSLIQTQRLDEKGKPAKLTSTDPDEAMKQYADFMNPKRKK